VPHITVQDLTKTFRVAERQAGTWGALRGLVRRRTRIVRALDGITFGLEPGELVGYIGPNGAGKSTTIKILAGIMVPDAGECRVLGRVPWLERVDNVRQIGVVFGQRTQLWWDLPVVESFELLRDIYRVPQADYARARDELVDILALGPFLDVPVRQLSLGQRMRCDLAAALMHSPSLLYLDEPTIGLDAISKLTVRDFLRQLNRERGVTVILTTHDMDDIEALCHRVLLINQGQILYDGALENLRAQVSPEREMIVDLQQGAEEFGDPQATVMHRDGQRVHLRFDPRQVSAAELIGRISARHAIRDLMVQNPPIEETIARLYREANDGQL
jgi:ABC-2 type transport system ATP-binding protein